VWQAAEVNIQKYERGFTNMRLANTKRILGGLALAGSLTVGASLGFAQQQQPQGAPQNEGGKEHGGGRRHDGRHGGKHGGMKGLGFFARNLNLTDAQKAQIEQITARHRESTKSLHEQGRAARQNGADNFGDGAFNETAVRQAAQARANLHVEMEVAHARMMSEVYAVLTPEQKAQLAAQRQQREQRRRERHTQRRTAGGGVTLDD